MACIHAYKELQGIVDMYLEEANMKKRAFDMVCNVYTTCGTQFWWFRNDIILEAGTLYSSEYPDIP